MTHALKAVARMKGDLLEPVDRVLLLVLAGHADEEGTCSLPLAEIATRVGRSLSTLRRSMARLEGLGLLQVEERKGYPSLYRLNLPRLLELASTAPSTGTTPSTHETPSIHATPSIHETPGMDSPPPPSGPKEEAPRPSPPARGPVKVGDLVGRVLGELGGPRPLTREEALEEVLRWRRPAPPPSPEIPKGMILYLREAGLWERLSALRRHARDGRAWQDWLATALGPLWQASTPDAFSKALAEGLSSLAWR